MSAKPKILVTSASGKTGLHTTLLLRKQGFPVRAFVRRLDHRSLVLENAGAEIFVGDQYALTDMRQAMQGVQRAYQCAPTAPNGLHFNVVFTVAAHEARLEHVVTLSQWLASAHHPSLFTREVYLSDALIGLSNEMSVTTVNPGWFADNYLMVLDMAAHLGVFTMPLGPGHKKMNAAPSNEDIARVVTQALIDPATHAGQTYRPTGPELMSPKDIAKAMGRALGRNVRYMNIPERMMVKALKALPPSNYSVAAVTQLAIYADEYRRGTFAVNAPNDHVAQVTGREPETFESIVQRTVSQRPDLSRSMGRTVGAMGGFMKILRTRPFKLREAEIARDFVRVSEPIFSQDDQAWLESHCADAPKVVRAYAKKSKPVSINNKGNQMSIQSDLIARNTKLAENFKHGELPALPKLNTAIVTCMDARVDPAHIFGLDVGEALVIRNTGGRVVKSVTEELATLAVLANKASGGRVQGFNVILMQHTKCGAQALAAPEMQKMLQEKLGIDASDYAITDQTKDLLVDIARLAEAPQVSDTLTVSAVLYDVETGSVQEIAPERSLADWRAELSASGSKDGG